MGKSRVAEDYVTIKLPRSLAEYIDLVIKSRYGYKSRAEFVRDAVREKLIRMGFFKEIKER